MQFRIGQTVEFLSGDVRASGEIVDVHSTCGLFVRADRAVPIVLGRGTALEYYTTGDRLWLKLGAAASIVRDRDGCAVGLELADDNSQAV